MKRKLDKLEALYRLNESILSDLNMNRLLEKVLDIIENTLGFDSCAILFLDNQSSELYIRAARGYTPEAIKTFRTTVGGRGITGHAAQTRQPLFIPDLRAEPRYIPGVDGARSEICIPLVTSEQFLGVLDIECRREFSFSQDDFDILVIFSSQIAVAIGHAMTIEIERRSASRLQIINEIRNRISLNLGMDRMLAVVARSIVEFLGFSGIRIFLWNPDEKRLQCAAVAPEGEAGEHPGEGIDPIVEQAFRDNRETSVSHPAAEDLADDALQRIGHAMPIRIQANPIGVIHLCTSNRGPMADKDRLVMEALCEHLGAILKDVISYAEATKKSKHSEVIQKIGQVTIQSFDYKVFINDIVQYIQDAFGYDHTGIFSFEKLSQQLELVSYAGSPPPGASVGDKFPLDEGIIGLVARSGQHHLCNDVLREARYRGVLLHTKSELAIPIRNEEEVFGVLNIESSRLNQFDKSDVEIFSRIADHICYTLVNAELFKQKTTAHNLLLNLNALSRRINSSFDLKKCIGAVVKWLPFYMNCRLCSIFFHVPEEKKLVLMGHNLPEVKSVDPISLESAGDNLMTRVIRMKRSVYIQDIESDLSIQNKPYYQTKSFLNILLRSRDRVIGVLNLTDKIDGTPFSSQEFHLACSFAQHLSVAVENCEKYQKILELSITDGLTGLYVHRFFQDTLSREIARAKRHENALAVIMMDIDDFKLFNDRFGHQIGDVVLREVAILIRNGLREYDVAARYGGEEFALVLPNTSLSQAKALAERLRSRIASHVVPQGQKKLRVTVSQGVCELLPDMNKAALIEAADRCLLQAKKEGKNRVVAWAG
ncbi:MAG: GAF domain-containing protein [Acidobacteria bacterium]|nr:GAF domain-containing protein [Acidobacteriota bacterium]